MRQLHSDYERLLETSKAQPGLIAQQELDDAQGKDLSSEAQVDAAKAAASAAEQGAEVAHSDNSRVQALKNYTNVVAPLDGVIVWRYADTGALIQSGDNSNEQDIPIVRLSESGLLRLRMPIPEDDVQLRAYWRSVAGQGRCHWPFFHRQDVRFHTRREL